MSTNGIKNIKFALVDRYGYLLTGANGIYKYTDKASSDTSGIFEADETTSKGVASLSIAGLVGNSTDITVNNKLIKKAPGKGSPQSTLSINSLPHEIKMAMFGLSNNNGSFQITGMTHPETFVATLAKTGDAFGDGNEYIGLYMGNAYEQAVSFATNTETISYNIDNIVIDHIERDRGFGKFFYDSMPGFNEDDMINDVFKRK